LLASLTGLGLSAAAGLNAWIPLLVVGVLGRFTNLVTLPASSRWLENGWVLALGGMLLVVEMVLDKVPLVDHANDLAQTLVRPAVGGAVFAATAAAERADASTWMHDHQWVGWVLGIAVAGLVHAGKATARPVVNVSTVGAGTPLVSAVEDVASLGMSLVAVFFPVLVVVVLLGLGWAGYAVARRVRRRRRRVAPAS